MIFFGKYFYVEIIYEMLYFCLQYFGKDDRPSFFPVMLA